MQPHSLIWILLAFSALAYILGKRWAYQVSGGHIRSLHSLPDYYGYYVALWCGLPAFLVLCLWLALDDHLILQWVLAQLPESYRNLPEDRLSLVINLIRNLLAGERQPGTVDPVLVQAAEHYRQLKSLGYQALTATVLALATAGLVYAKTRITPQLRARNAVERAILVALILSSTLAILTTIGIVLSVLFEALRFFKQVPVTEFLFGLHWSPQMAIRPDQVGASGAFGFIPLLTGTLLISAIAMLVATPVGLFSAIYLAEFSQSRTRAVIKPLLEVLAGIPTVVYGFFAALLVAPAIRDLGDAMGLTISSESALAAGLVMGIMIIPFISSLTDDALTAVPRSLREGALGLGATRAETVAGVVLPAALPGIVSGLLLAVSRAVGETMIVVMAAGMTAKLTLNPLDSVTTITVQIVGLLVGDQEFDSPKTLAAFALGLTLFLITLLLNLIALHVVRKYRETYE
ncbi:phosphate transport system permease protein [Methylomarinovum caldicuralii]|uniref:Phosphate transport system permease protein n=1 Tax=Methylomarinovum caldicuralii TaxID=438856 RepID=A0AAU9BZ42_9GAMM|nr:phosphate ABC transporter permease subunit PstC [Methylomarinovum caldicuralii]BCX80458.1 phosphate transport system permease protein [Methylomarinovum caldicuralii]